MANKTLSFEHQVLRRLKMRIQPPSRWLLAVSGGVDSMVMLEVLKRWRKFLKCEMMVAHVHHGADAKPSQKRFRAKSQKLVEEYCAREKLKFITNTGAALNLKNEADFRAFRQTQLENWRQELQCDFVIYAHHRDDLLETRLLRLIRGTGEAGLAAMKRSSHKKLRPLLDSSKKDIETYAAQVGLKWLEDPSNENCDALRNWIRHEWLPALEKKQKGATKSLTRSLEILSRRPRNEGGVNASAGLRRNSLDEKTVASYLRQLGVKNYGRTHVQEILKRIDTRQKNLTFEMLGLVFKVTPDLLTASRV